MHVLPGALVPAARARRDFNVLQERLLRRALYRARALCDRTTSPALRATRRPPSPPSSPPATSAAGAAREEVQIRR